MLDLCRARGLRIATAESCTGGLVAAALTEIAGSSDVVDCGFVTYSNEAKQTMLGVPAATLSATARSARETAAAMAKGALKNSRADIAVAITGIAGPGGGSKRKSRSDLFTSPPRAATADASRAAGVSARSDGGGCGCARSRKRWGCWKRWPKPLTAESQRPQTPSMRPP